MKNSNKVKIIPLGGMHEIGKNIDVIEYRDDIIIIDCGLTFPEEEQLGIDIVIPDFQYLVENKHRIKGLVLTHGHEDHIGAIPYLLKKIKVPIYGTALTIGLLENKLKEHRLGKVDLNVVKAGDNIKLGKMEVEWINVNHSIPDACALAVKTPLGYIYHSGDFKVDFNPIQGNVINLQRIAEIGEKGVLAMIGESTNVLREGYTLSESKVGETFKRLFTVFEGRRIIIATFASNVHRIQQIINASENHGRKVVLSGRSMLNVMETARKLGYLRAKKDTLIDINDMKKYKPGDLTIITTGSQGEPMSALTRIAYGEHRKIHLIPDDVVILSATPIPGNEMDVTKIINKMIDNGTEVVYEALSEIHVSGHACQEELKLILDLVRPKYFVPAHGEIRHLNKHKEIAVSMGTPEENVFVMNNGDVLEISQRGARIAGQETAGDVLVDGLGIGDVGNIVLRDRKHLSEDGLIVAVVGITKQGQKLVTGPEIISRGFVYVRESEDLMEEAKKVVEDIIKSNQGKDLYNRSNLKNNIRNGLRTFLFQKTKRNPMILPVIMDI